MPYSRNYLWYAIAYTTGQSLAKEVTELRLLQTGQRISSNLSLLLIQ